MRRGLQRTVSPRAAAVVILLVIAAIQAWWWRAFIWKPPIRSGTSMNPVTPMPPGPTIEQGRPDVMVSTLAGEVAPGADDGPSWAARFDTPAGLAIEPSGALIVADSRNHRIRRVQPDGRTTTIAGSVEGLRDGPASRAQFRLPCGVAVAPDGTVYVADTGNHCIRRIRNGMVTTLAGGVRGLAQGEGRGARFNTPTGLAYVWLPQPALVVADYGNRRVRRVTLDGSVDVGVACPGAPVSVTGGDTWVAACPDAGVVFGPSGALPAVRTQIEGIPLRHPGVAVPIGRSGGSGSPPIEWVMTDAEQGAVCLVRGGVAEVLAGAFQSTGSSLAWRDFAGNEARFGRIGGVVISREGYLYVSDLDANAIRRIVVPELVQRKEQLH